MAFIMSGNGAVRGREGEEIARRYLRDHGYLIVARNWHCRFGEIDLIARDDDTLVFVEVKARASSGFGGPEGAVTLHKQARLIAAARAYLRDAKSEIPVRFDVVTVTPGRVKLYKDAFQVE